MNDRYPWHQTQWLQLCKRFSRDTLSHALLFTGLTGLGKYTFSKAFAKFIFCLDKFKYENRIACNRCKQCHLIDNNSHPDLQILTIPEGANIIKVDQVRRLIALCNTTAQYQGYKINIIYPAEKMNLAAANALLKILEEPQGKKTLFILVANHFMQLPATIRSRCQRIDFFPPPAEQTKAWLALQKDINPNNVNFEFAWEYAQGAPLRMLDLLLSNEFEIQAQCYADLKDWILSKRDKLSIISQKMNKLPLNEFIYCLQLVSLNLIKSESRLDKIKLHNLLDDLNSAKGTLAKNIQLNPQLVIENYLSKAQYLQDPSKNRDKYVN